MTKTKMDPAALSEGLKRLQASYPSVPPLDEMNIAAYAEALADRDGRDFIAATKTVVKVCKFFPSIAEIIEHIEPIEDERRRKESEARRIAEHKRYAEELLLEGDGAARLTFAQRFAQARAELESQGVLPKMPTGKLVDTTERRQMLMAQAEQLRGESDAEWDARKKRLMEQARELSDPAQTRQTQEMQP